ncbi:cadherin repeat domain-containing protein, partial [bacterium]|nr:cadherin repeat domain-containing protein [bacterium]
ITGGNVGKAFAINSATGAITVNKSAAIDFETLHSFDLSVQVTDGGGLFRKAVMTINVNDLNDQPLISPQTFNVDENSPNGTSVGAVVAIDPDAMDVFSYAITGGNVSHAFAINATTGEITVNNSLALDFETTPTFNITVQVTDSHGLSRKAVMTINLNDLMELNAGLFSEA